MTAPTAGSKDVADDAAASGGERLLILLSAVLLWRFVLGRGVAASNLRAPCTDALATDPAAIAV